MYGTSSRALLYPFLSSGLRGVIYHHSLLFVTIVTIINSGLRGVISLEGACIAAVDEPGSPGPYKDYDPSLPPFRIELTVPARRLSLLTPGISPGAFGRSPATPPSLEAKMTFLEKVLFVMSQLLSQYSDDILPQPL